MMTDPSLDSTRGEEGSGEVCVEESSEDKSQSQGHGWVTLEGYRWFRGETQGPGSPEGQGKGLGQTEGLMHRDLRGLGMTSCRETTTSPLL